MCRSECPWRLYVLVSASSFSFGHRDLSLFIQPFFFFFLLPLKNHCYSDGSWYILTTHHLRLTPRLFRLDHRRLGHSFRQLRPSSSPSLILRIGICHRLATGVCIPDRSAPFLVTAWCILRRWGSHRSPSDFNIPVIKIACLC